MGDNVSAGQVSREHRQRYREKVQLCLDIFEKMLRTGDFDTDEQLTGMEIEFNLVDGQGMPAMVNQAVLSELQDPEFTTELGAFNIELNVPPRRLSGDCWQQLEHKLVETLSTVERSAGTQQAHVAMVGILPTLMPDHFDGQWMTDSARYVALNDSIFSARGEDLFVDIEGCERLAMYAESIAPEAACTSMQLHVQVSPRQFPAYWNAAQALLAPQVALGANSPFLFGRKLWAETRIELFKQATDTRPPELRNQGVRPRVFFGDRWITSIFDLFDENVRYFPSLLPVVTDEDPIAVLESGKAPVLQELRLHNGTVYRWNRPVYDVVNGRPHLRVENRALPAGPTIVDTIANAMFYYGAVRVLAEDEPPVWSKLSFSAAQDNFEQCARLGMEAELYWPGTSEVGVAELVLRKLLPMAERGLQDWGVDQDVIDKYLGVIESRAKTGQTGAAWQVNVVDRLERSGVDRGQALRTMFGTYLTNMRKNQPVHEWSTELTSIDLPTQHTKGVSPTPTTQR